MNNLTIAITAAVVAAAVIYVLMRRRHTDTLTQALNAQQAAQANQATTLILEQLNDLSRSMEERLNAVRHTVDSRITDLNKTVDGKMTESRRTLEETNRTMHDELRSSQKLIKDITVEVTAMKEIGRQTATFADEVRNLQDILKNPKQRGILGEYYLATLLRNVLPPGQFALQYEIGLDEKGAKMIVDAAVFVRGKVIPIDSKFSLENYNRLTTAKGEERVRLEKLFVNDLKERIVETSKYIRPEFNTMDFAFMFIPHEAIYYDLLVNAVGGNAPSDRTGVASTAANDENENLIQRAAAKYKVIIVSPTSFLAYLQTVLQGLKALQIEETATDIIRRVDELGRHLKRFEEFHGKVGSTLGTVVSHYNNAHKELRKIDKDVLRITGTALTIAEQAIEKPDIEE
jgi:DNA recombination protein RmuC